MIRKCGPRCFKLVSKSTGRTLGKHATRAKAKAQETAINLSKARAAGHDVPAPLKR
jgi:hypothetical protein